MLETPNNTIAKPPRHIAVIGFIALLWSALGALDYLMTQTKNASYMSSYTAEQLEFFYGLPSWVVAAWAIAVWGGVLGALLLILKREFAARIFLLSLIAMLITALQNYGLSNGMEVMGDIPSLLFTFVIFAISFALFIYARAMQQRGFLI